MNYEIIDNFLPKSEFKKIKGAVFDPEFPWLYQELKSDSNGTLKKICTFNHTIYDQNVPLSPFFDEMALIYRKTEGRSLLNISCNMILREDNFVDRKINPIYPFPNTKSIFYLNNSNGYTLIDDVKIENLENRMVLFDASTPYIDSNCTDSTRKVTITFNYI